MDPCNKTEMTGKYSELVLISSAQQTVTTAAPARGMLGFFSYDIGPETRQAERMEGGGVAAKCGMETRQL